MVVLGRAAKEEVAGEVGLVDEDLDLEDLGLGTLQEIESEYVLCHLEKQPM